MVYILILKYLYLILIVIKKFYDVKRNFFLRIFYFYYEGFRNMTVGKRLWLIIGIKLFVFFIVLRLLFFPDFLKTRFDTEEEKANYVLEQLIK
ncbi:MAG: DUF4492 domain-containing protein [Bacteroidales bacterium]|nr:DUF4492 domain-containing protein [Bacteroidales bacterium]